MSLEGGRVPSRGGSGHDLWPKWMWIAVPVLVVVVVVGLWWAIFAPTEPSAPVPTPTPTARLIQTQPTQAPTVVSTLAAPAPTAAVQSLPVLPTFTPVTAASAATPTGEPTAAPAANLSIGAKATVNVAAGVNMRSGAGTGQSRIKLLPRNSVVEIIGGPKEANGYVWWQIRDEAGTEGWAAADYLALQAGTQ